MKIHFDHETLDAYQKALLVGLIRSNSRDRLYEETVAYQVGGEE